MPYPIRTIAGEDEAKKFETLRIRTVEGFLDAAASSKSREQLAEQTGINKQRLLALANLADRMRIKGMGRSYAELVHAAGVSTINELRYRNPKKLAEAMGEANRQRKLVRVLPSQSLVGRWIEHAKRLTIKVTH
jgi:uncharacterized protein DUF4332